MRLVFIRHAQSTGNAEGRFQGQGDEFELSEQGTAQARKLHERFKQDSFQPTHVYSSPQKRTAQTARIASGSWPLEIAFWDDLKEHEVGIFTGLTWDEISQMHPETAEAFRESRDWNVVKGAETFQERRERGRRVVDTILQRHANDDVVVLFTHGGVLQHFVSVLLGSERTWGVPVQNTGIFDFSLDVERWTHSGDVLHYPALWRINRFNDVSHLL